MTPLLRTLIFAAFFALTISACGGGGQDAPSSTPIADPATAVAQAAGGTIQATSYHLDVTFSPIGHPIVYGVDFDRGNYFERIPDTTTGNYSEYVFHGDRTYRRDCTASGACASWRSEVGRLLIPNLAGSVTSVPETLAPFLALMATDITLVDPAAMKFSGTVDLTAATEENLRQALTAAGNTPEEVETAIRELSANRPPTGSSAIDVTLTADGHYMSNVVVYVPDQKPDPYLELTYSSYNAVTVEPPQGF